jgi:hypothetical protein
VNGGKWRKEKHISLDNSPLLFQIVSKLVPAHAIIYNEIFQGIVAGGNILLPKPFLNPTPHFYCEGLENLIIC